MHPICASLRSSKITVSCVGMAGRQVPAGVDRVTQVGGEEVGGTGTEGARTGTKAEKKKGTRSWWRRFIFKQRTKNLEESIAGYKSKNCIKVEAGKHKLMESTVGTFHPRY